MKDPWGSWQENERSLKILARKWKILEDLGKKMKDPWRSWQENERSLKILARKWRILEDLNKNFEDPHEDPQEDPQRSSWRSCKILKDPWKIFTRVTPYWQYQQQLGDNNWKTCDLEGIILIYCNYSAISQVIFTQSKASIFLCMCFMQGNLC